MNDPGLGPGTAERMLRAEPTGPPKLAALLTAAASCEPTTEDLNGEQAALAAFREARSLHPRRPRIRRLPALVSAKAALIGLLLILAGGITAAAASQHLPGPNKHAHKNRTPTNSQTTVTPILPRAPSRPTPDSHHKHPQKTAHPKKHPHPTKKPKRNPPKSNLHRPTSLTGPVPLRPANPVTGSCPKGQFRRQLDGRRSDLGSMESGLPTIH